MTGRGFGRARFSHGPAERLALKICVKETTVAVLAVLTLAMAGCQTVPPENPANWPVSQEPRVELQPGDQLRILYTYWPELNEEQAIRPDGKVALQLVGDVQAAGYTPDELRAHLLQLYAGKLKDPEIVVAVDGFSGQRVYVGGEVRQPGVLPLSGRMTVLEAIMQAGGPIKQSAKLSTVVLVRMRDGQRHARSINVAKALSEPESEPVFLEPYDVIFVPRTAIDQVNQFVDQYIDEIIPRSVYWNLTYDLNQQDFNNDSNTFQISPTAGF
jgi:polysaccharide export outer membrane protein